MAFGVETWWEVQVGGSDTANGGGFDKSATFATDLAATNANTSSPVVTSASYNFISRDEGHFLFIKTGTNWAPGFYEILSTSGGAATLKAAIGEAVLYFGATDLNTVAGCATAASPTGGTWGIDYSRKVTSVLSYTDMVIDGTTNTKYTSAANPVGPHIVGNIVNVLSGTGFTVQRAEIISVAGTVATCDKSLGTLSSTGGTGNLGGALATPGKASGVMTYGNIIFLKYNATVYTSNSVTGGVAGGQTNIPNGTGVTFTGIVGYDTTRTIQNIDNNQPTIRAGINNVILVRTNGSCFVRNIKFDNPSGTYTGVTGVNLISTYDWVERCQFYTLSNGTQTASYNSTINCYAQDCTSCGIHITNHHFTYGCVSKNCAGSFNGGVGGCCVDCMNISPTTNPAFQIGDYSDAVNCMAYGGPISAVHFQPFVASRCTFINCLSVNAPAYAFQNGGLTGTFGRNKVIRGFVFNPGTAAYDPGFSGENILGLVTLTADPFTNAAGGDFTLNDDPGGGALVKAASYPGTVIGTSHTSYLDGGALQSQGGGSGGGLMNLGMRGGFAE